MSKNKVVDVGGTRYTVRGLTFEELVKLGSANTEEKEGKTIVAEVLQKCLIEPMLKTDQIKHLDDKTLMTLLTEVLDIAKIGLDGVSYVAMPTNRGIPRDMIA